MEILKSSYGESQNIKLRYNKYNVQKYIHQHPQEKDINPAKL